jgi:hypothetical protein
LVRNGFGIVSVSNGFSSVKACNGFGSVFVFCVASQCEMVLVVVSWCLKLEMASAVAYGFGGVLVLNGFGCVFSLVVE